VLKAVKQNCATCKEEDSKLVDHDLDWMNGAACVVKDEIYLIIVFELVFVG